MSSKHYSFGEALTVGFFRYIEEKYPADQSGSSGGDENASQDIPLLETEKDSQGRLTDPARFISRRAEILLPKRVPLTREGVERYARRFLRWMPLVIAICGLAAFPLGKASAILAGKEVNLAGGFFWFLCGQLFFLALSLFFFVLFLLRTLWCFLLYRHNVRVRNEQGFLSRLSSFTGYVVFHFPEWISAVGSFFHRHFGRGNRMTSVKRLSDERQKIASPYLDFLDFLFSHRAATYFLSGFYSHLFWLFTSLGILLFLFCQMWGNEYKYSCRTSLGDIDHVRAIVQFFGRPFESLVTLPDDHDIAWLFESQPPSEAVATVSRTRVHWSHFLLTTFFTWAVLPRLLLVLIYGFALQCSLRTFRPSLKDHYYAKIIEQEEDVQRDIVHYQIFDEDETPDLPETYHTGPLAAGTELADSSYPVDSIGVQTDPQEDSAVITVAFGCESQMPTEQWQKIFGDLCTPVVFGDVTQSPQTKREFIEWLDSHRGKISRCVMLTDCSLPPARQLTRFLQTRILPAIPSVEFFVILSCGERLRAKYETNTQAVRERLENWENLLESLARQTGVPVTIVSFYDHELDLPSARGRLNATLSQKEPGAITNDEKKLERSCDLVIEHTGKIFANPELYSSGDDGDAEMLQLLTDYYEKLTVIYREESRSFMQSALAALPEGLGPAASLSSDVIGRTVHHVTEGLDSQKLRDKLLGAVATMERMKTFCSRLSPKCAICAGSLAACIPLAVAAAPLVAGSLSVASVAAVVTNIGAVVPGVALSGVTGSALGAVLPMSLSAIKDKITGRIKNFFPANKLENEPESNRIAIVAIHVFLTSALTWIALFELQGTPEAVIVERLPDIMIPLEEATPCDLDSVTHCVREVAERIHGTELHQSRKL